jgi:hypothetical protein
MQEDLDALSDWLNFYKLKLNVSKTKFLITTSKRSSATYRALMTIEEEQIEEVHSMKYIQRASELGSEKNRQEDEFSRTNLEKTNSPYQDDDT